jgi:hypothetical protein
MGAVARWMGWFVGGCWAGALGQSTERVGLREWDEVRLWLVQRGFEVRGAALEMRRAPSRRL